MSRLVPVLSLGCLAAIGFTAYGMLYGAETQRIAVPTGGTARPAPDPGEELPDELATDLDETRRSHSAEKIARLITGLRARVAKLPKDRDSWRRLAAALLQKVVQRGHLIGMRPGRPVYGKLPDKIVAELDSAHEALEQARKLGDDSAELFRVSAELMSQRITGLSTALKWNGKIEEAIAEAGKRMPDDPELHLVLGVRKLMAPRFFGQDIEQSLEHFRYVAESRPTDERPAIFAAMASHLTKKRLEAIRWLEQAVERNPNNVFARVVLQRVRRGEDDPFGRDVTAAEAAAGK